MKGATALPSVRTINKPMSNIIKTIGPSHHFLRVFKKSQNSETILILLFGSDGLAMIVLLFLSFKSIFKNTTTIISETRFNRNTFFARRMLFSI